MKPTTIPTASNPHRLRRRSSPRPALWVALVLLAGGCGDRDSGPAGHNPPPTPPGAAQAPAVPAQSAAPAAPPPSAAAKPLGELESLVAPIALYPDPLLAELLVASTYPLEVVQAARWLETQPDPSTLKTQPWDASVIRLVEVPQVLKMMNDHLEWTTRLGDAFLAQPAEVTGAIQTLRQRATASGFLKDTPEQKVVKKAVATPEDPTVDGHTAPAAVKQQAIYIEPAKADTVYVPQYNPETAYAAPLAPPPTNTATYPATSATPTPMAAPAQAYYPGYYPPASTTSTTDPLLTFGAGALAGGLLTWGIMEWSDHDDDYYPVSHYYGNAVCQGGNCWQGGGGYGGGGYQGNIDRGDLNRTRNVNITGNDINIDRSRRVSRDQLATLKTPDRWQPEARHRRGQAYPAAAQPRLGQVRPPALAGDRLGSAQTLPAEVRGFGDRGGPAAGARRPSTAEVRQQLAQSPKPQEPLATRKPGQARPESKDIQRNLAQGNRPNALEGLREPGQQARLDERRGAESRQKPQAKPRAPVPPKHAGGGPPPDRARAQQGQQFKDKTQQRPGIERPPATGGGPNAGQFRDQQKRVEAARPNAFEGARDAGRTRDFSQRGAASRQNMAAARPNVGGGQGGGAARNKPGGSFQGGGGARSGGGGRPSGGGGPRGRRG